MKSTLTLENIPLDLQITICIFLLPSDILALRKTCKALEFATRKRIVWMAALHRVCLDNTLFLPTFPIPDMSDLELERAAMAPRRWIELCSASEKHRCFGSSEMLLPRTTRMIKEMTNFLFIVPGGRYLVTTGFGLFVWDLGYVSTVDCKLVASVKLQYRFGRLKVQATPDGKGLVILSYYRKYCLSVFEIYPQSEIPLLTEIADIDWSPLEEEPAHLLPDTLICRVFHEDRIVFRVVDYRTNYSTFFSADVDLKKIDPTDKYNVETFATKTAIIVFCRKGILIWAIPPLSPQPSDLPYDSLDNDFTHIPPLFKIPFPAGIVRHTWEDEILEWKTVSSWYFGSWESIYFNFFYAYSKESKLQRFKIIIKPDLSDASLHVINASQVISYELMKSLKAESPCEGYRICEDALVYFWNNCSRTWGAYTGLISAPFTNVVTLWIGRHDVESLCPTSGRYVYRTVGGDGTYINKLVVADLF